MSVGLYLLLILCRTFLTMHDLTPSATVLYASESIEDVLGYDPDEVIGKSCFDYFHPDELPFARDKHTQSIHFDNAAVLAYCRYIFPRFPTHMQFKEQARGLD